MLNTEVWIFNILNVLSSLDTMRVL